MDEKARYKINTRTDPANRPPWTGAPVERRWTVMLLRGDDHGGYWARWHGAMRDATRLYNVSARNPKAAAKKAKQADAEICAVGIGCKAGAEADEYLIEHVENCATLAVFAGHHNDVAEMEE